MQHVHGASYFKKVSFEPQRYASNFTHAKEKNKTGKKQNTVFSQTDINAI